MRQLTEREERERATAVAVISRCLAVCQLQTLLSQVLIGVASRHSHLSSWLASLYSSLADPGGGGAPMIFLCPKTLNFLKFGLTCTSSVHTFNDFLPPLPPLRTKSTPTPSPHPLRWNPGSAPAACLDGSLLVQGRRWMSFKACIYTSCHQTITINWKNMHLQ